MFLALDLAVSAQALSLVPHPDGGSTSVRGLIATLAGETEALVVRYTLTAPLDTLRLPLASAAPARRDELWRHTCFELFVMGADGVYHEFNFSPSGDWQAYRFEAYRRRGGTQPATAPRLDIRRNPTTLTLDARVPRAALPTHPVNAALTAVIEDAAGVLSYWALHHAPGKPDFHHPAGFTVAL